MTQHLPTAVLPAGVTTAIFPSDKASLDAIARSADACMRIAALQEFIALRPDAREVRKALFCKAGLSRLLI